MKRIISILLLLAMLVGTFSIGASAAVVTDNNFTLGDVNGDGVIDAGDALAACKYLSGSADASVRREALDLDADDNVTAYDVYLLRQCLAGEKELSAFDNPEALYQLTIAGNPINTYSIVIPADVPEDTSENRKLAYGMNTYYAATELRRYILIATGVIIPDVHGDYDTENAIFFHVEDEEGELGVDGYIYEVVDGQLHIYGTRRGYMYAIFDILEEYLGFRFYSQNNTFLYKNRTVDIPEGVYVKKLPLVSFRVVGQSFSESTKGSYSFPRKMNGSNSTYSSYEGTSTGPHFINAHSLGYYFQMYHGPEAPAGTESPLSYRYNNGDKSHTGLNWMPCFTSNSEYEELFEGLILVMRMITEEWSHVFRKTTSYMSFSMMDTDGLSDPYCRCADCSTLYATEGIMGAIVYFASRAARDVQEYFPGMKLMTGAYVHDMPNNVYPDENLVIYYWGNGCNNHFFGSGECGDNLGLLGKSNTHDEAVLKAWGDVCTESGAEIWFWYYPVTYAYYLIGCPNIINIYHDFKFVVEECHVTGIYHEGGGKTYNFETLKAYLASRMIADPDMTEEEFVDALKEYLYMYYGDGYEAIYKYIVMQNEAGDGAGCFINNYDRPREMYNYEYIDAHYEEMRALLVEALDGARTAEQYQMIQTLITCCDFLGLTCVHYRYYRNGDDASRALYMERYDAMYNYIKNNGMQIFGDADVYTLPNKISYDEDPMYQFYGNERPDSLGRYFGPEA